MQIDNNTDWQQTESKIFWGEIAPCDHVVQIYENDGVFLDALTGFVGGGVNGGDCVIVIATAAHLKALKQRLLSYGLPIDELIAENRYIPLDAQETLNKFMVNDWPDTQLFMQTVSNLFAMARKNNRRIRAFGEMVALLWAEGHNGATVHLEHLWNEFCEKAEFCLFCAYPKSGFTQDMTASILNICGAHSKLIKGSYQPLSEIHYQVIE